MLKGIEPSCASTLPVSWRTCRDALAIRKSSSTLTDAKSGRRRKRRRARQPAAVEPQLAAALGRHPPLGERPRRSLEHIPVLHVPVRQHVLDVVGQAPHLLLAHDIDCRGGGDGVVVVDQLQQRFLDVARTRLEEQVAATDTLLARHVLEHRQHLLAERAREEVVEVFRCARSRARIAVFERPACRVDVGGRWTSVNRLKIRLRSRVICSSRPCERSESGWLLLSEQVVVNREEMRVTSPFQDHSSSAGSPLSVNSGCSRRSRSSAEATL